MPSCHPASGLWLTISLVLCIVPALFLAVEGATEMPTADETYMIRDVTDFNQLQSRQWDLGSYHTSIAVTGNVVNAITTS